MIRGIIDAPIMIAMIPTPTGIRTGAADDTAAPIGATIDDVIAKASIFLTSF